MNPMVLTLAQRLTREERLQRLRQGFNTELASNELLIAGLAVLVLGVLVLLIVAFCRRERTQKAEPRQNYLRAATRVLGLTRRERADLTHLAERAGLAHPAAMLLSPGNLAHAWQRAFGTGGDERLRVRLNALCQKLYGQPLPNMPRRAPT